MTVLIGDVFGSLSQITVVELLDKKKWKNTKVFKVHCSICCRDKDLYGDGFFDMDEVALRRGHISCGCSKSFSYDRSQQIAVAKRILSERNHILVSTDDWNKSKTLITAMCELHNILYKSQFVHLPTNGCRECRKTNISKSKRELDDYYINKFVLTGSYPEGTEFKRSNKKINSRAIFWKYKCPLCSVDKYAKGGVCTGWFDQNQNYLLKGKHSCRCNKSVYWTEQQREFQLSEITKDSLVKFVEWVGKYKDVKSRVKMSCKLHGEWETSFQSVYNGCLCPGCAKTGYQSNKAGYIYTIFAKSPNNESFCGYGISNVPYTRFKTHLRHLTDHGFKLYSVYMQKTSGCEARSIENKLKSIYSKNICEVPGFKTESSFGDDYFKVVEFIKGEIEMDYEELKCNTLEDFITNLELEERENNLFHSLYFIPEYYQPEEDVEQ